MHTHTDPDSDSRMTSTPSTPPQRSSLRWVFFAFLAIAAYFLWTEHRAHLLGGLGWLPHPNLPTNAWFSHTSVAAPACARLPTAGVSIPPWA